MITKKKVMLLEINRMISRSKGYYHNLRQDLLRKWHNPELQTKPIFVVGCGRSGTTMLLRQLSTSWQIEPFNEDHPTAFDNWRLRRLDAIKDIINGCQAPIALFKPILNTTQSNEFLTTFPDAKILFVYRNYNDVINSSLKSFGVENRRNHIKRWMSNDFDEFAFAPPPEKTKRLVRSLWNPLINNETGAALYWLFYNRLYYDMGMDNDERIILVNYEDLAQNPRSGFERVTRFIGVSYSEKMIDGVFTTSLRKDPSPSVAEKVIHACQELWQNLRSGSQKG
ncbi:MAG: sulfotransferase [Anaerolineales bacterium]|jgi:hypothetical protein